MPTVDNAIVDQPIYFISEAARYLCMPASTVHQWSMGRNDRGKKTVSLIEPADRETPLLSFSNLIELHILGSLRKIHGLTLKPIRLGIDYLRRYMKKERPLLDQEMMTDGKSLFIEYLQQHINISKGGQLSLWSNELDLRLDRIERDINGICRKLFPFTRSVRENTPKIVALNPSIKFGRPCLSGTRLTTEIIAGRYRAGDSIGTLALDYERPIEEIEEAIRYESRTAA